MTVTFSKNQLITAANKALREHERVRVEYGHAVNKYLADHATEATQRTRQSARRLRDELTKQLRKTGPIPTKDLESVIGNASSLRDRFYNPPQSWDIKNKVTQPQGLLGPAEVVETRALISVLRAAIGDTISVAELTKLGMKNLARVFVVAATEKA